MESQRRNRVPRRRGASAGLTLLEVVIAITVTTVILIASAAAFSGSVNAVNQAKRMGRAAAFLETVMEDLAAQSYSDLPSFNGNAFYDQASPADSDVGVTVTVFLSAVDLLQLRAVLTDLRTGEVIGDVVTLRTRR